MLIGLSVSMCIGDVVRGSVRLQDVAYIIGGTCLSDDPAVMAEWLGMMRQTYWRADPVWGQHVFQELWESGRILQPRKQGGPSLNVAAGHWIECAQVHKPQAATPSHSDWEFA